MALPRDLFSFNEMWKKLQGLAQIANTTNFPFDLFFSTGSSGATLEPLNLWVDATNGLDVNPGTVERPFKTIQAALDSLPRRIRHLVKITVAAGEYQGFYLNSFIMDPAPGVTVHGILILGTYVTVTPATGTATGTFTSVVAGNSATPTFSTLADSAQTWTVDGLKGYLVEILTGTSAGTLLPIISNTATTLTIASNSAIGSIGGTYAIRDWGSVITSTITQPGTLFQSTFTPVVATHAIVVRNNTCGITGSILIEGMKCNLASSTTSISTQGNNGIVRFDKCCVFGPGIPFSTGGAGTTQFGSCVFRCTGNIGGLIGTVGGSWSIIGCLISATSKSIGTGLQIQGSSAVGGINATKIENHSFGMKIVTTGSCLITLNGVSIDNSGSSQAVLMSALGHINWGGTNVQATGLEVLNCSTAFQVGGANQVWCDSLQATNCTYGVIAERGARIQLGAASTMTNCTNELYMDGGVVTPLATMRAANPKLVKNDYGSIVFE